MLILLGAPLGCLWAVLTLPRRSSLASGLGKLGLGVVILFLMMLEWKESLLVFSIAGSAVVTALLGLVELVAAKVAIDRQEDSEQKHAG